MIEKFKALSPVNKALILFGVVIILGVLAAHGVDTEFVRPDVN